MSVGVFRGGIPRVWRASIDSVGQRHQLPFWCNWLKIRVDGASEPCKMYFTEDDYTNDVNYVLCPLSAADQPYGEWSGPVEACELWFKSATASNSEIELVVFQRRG